MLSGTINDKLKSTGAMHLLGDSSKASKKGAMRGTMTNKRHLSEQRSNHFWAPKHTNLNANNSTTEHIYDITLGR